MSEDRWDSSRRRLDRQPWEARLAPCDSAKKALWGIFRTFVDDEGITKPYLVGWCQEEASAHAIVEVHNRTMLAQSVDSQLPWLRISEDAGRFLGYFTDDSTYVAHDPGIGALCPICYRPLSIDDVRTISLMYTDSALSCFYRVHLTCHEALSVEERQRVEGRMLDLLPAKDPS